MPMPEVSCFSLGSVCVWVKCGCGWTWPQPGAPSVPHDGMLFVSWAALSSPALGCWTRWS